MPERVQVILRVRPQAHGVAVTTKAQCLQIMDNTECSVALSSQERRFTFDHLFGPNSTQDEVFCRIGTGPVDDVLAGYNATLLCYGQTGSGKTHTMFGPDGGSTPVLTASDPQFHQRGLIPRMLHRLFQQAARIPVAEASVRVTISACELYREGLCDLLQPNAGLDYRIREDITRGVYVENLSAVAVGTPEEAYDVLRRCVLGRTVAATRANDTSSRSHCIVVVNVEQTSHIQAGSRLTGKLTLVDLAGSEKVSKTGAEGDRLKEAQTINLSLTLLGNVIFKLTDPNCVHVPYRDSKLTRILQDSLGGNARTTLLCNCSAQQIDKSETVSTLLFAARAKNIHNRPRVNKEMSLQELTLAYAKAQQEIGMLRERLALLEKSSGEATATVSVTDTVMSTPAIRSPPADEVELRGTVQSLLRELNDVRSELFDRQRDIVALQQQVAFYQRHAAVLEERLSALPIPKPLLEDSISKRSPAVLRPVSPRGCDRTPSAARNKRKSGTAFLHQRLPSKAIEVTPAFPSPLSARNPSSAPLSLTPRLAGIPADTAPEPPLPKLDESAFAQAKAAETAALIRAHELQLVTDDLREELAKAREITLCEKQRAVDAEVKAARTQAELEILSEKVDILQRQLASNERDARQMEETVQDLRRQLAERDTVIQKTRKPEARSLQGIAMDVIVRTESLLELENGVYMIEALEMDCTERAQNKERIEAELTPIIEFTSIALADLDTTNINSDVVPLRRQVTDLKAAAEALLRRLYNPHRSGGRRTKS